ncbi:hypothetical protein ACWD4N_33130 [Streptomyces sp. NPDC002586]
MCGELGEQGSARAGRRLCLLQLVDLGVGETVDSRGHPTVCGLFPGEHLLVVPVEFRGAGQGRAASSCWRCSSARSTM